MVRKVAIYTRVSTLDQTIDNQLLELRDHCSKMGWEVVKEYADEGLSGTLSHPLSPAGSRSGAAAARRPPEPSFHDLARQPLLPGRGQTLYQHVRGGPPEARVAETDLRASRSVRLRTRQRLCEVLDALSLSREDGHVVASIGRPPGRRRPCPSARKRRAALEASAQVKRLGGYPALALREGTGPVSEGAIF